jgi:hypothetical protein
VTRIEERITGLPMQVGARGSSRSLSAPAGSVAGHRLVSAPDALRDQLAHAYAAEIARQVDLGEVEVRWFAHRSDAPLAFVVSRYPETIFLRETLTGEQLAEAVPHEVAHLWQFRHHGDDLTEEEAEEAAHVFSEQMCSDDADVGRSEPLWTGTRAWPSWAP